MKIYTHIYNNNLKSRKLAPQHKVNPSRTGGILRGKKVTKLAKKWKDFENNRTT
jgi:hypothetical protein